MTTYKAIEVIIKNKSVRKETAGKMVFDAYYKDKIDGQEYEELMTLIDRKLKW